MINRIKQCYFCGQEFHAKRIDTMYCSNSCKMMAYRRDHEHNKYDNRKPIHFELGMVSYGIICENAEESGKSITEYIKDMCERGDQDQCTVQLDKSTCEHLRNLLTIKYPGKSWKDAFNLWLIEMITSEKLNKGLNELKEKLNG